MSNARVPRWLNDEAAVDQGDESPSSVDYSYSVTSGRTYDTIEDLLSRFTLDFRPDYIVKLRNRMGPLIVGVDAGHNPNTKDNAVSLIVKPVDRMQRWRRLRLDSSGDITVRSRKLRWWVFTLDLQGTVNLVRRTSDASFRLATKWDLARGQYHNKRRVNLGEATEGRVHWGVNYNLPEVAGSFGASRREVDRGMHAEVGYAHADVAKVELVVWPLRNNPKWEGTGRYLGVREDVDVVEELVDRSSNGVKADGGGAETHGRDVLLPSSGGGVDGAAKMAVHTRADARWNDLHAHVRHLRSHFKLPNSQKN